MKIELINENLRSLRISKDFEIRVGDKELVVNKWCFEDDYECNADSNFDNESQAVFDSLSEEEQDEVLAFINELSLTNPN